jgi:hypothetical protein
MQAAMRPAEEEVPQLSHGTTRGAGLRARPPL